MLKHRKIYLNTLKLYFYYLLVFECTSNRMFTSILRSDEYSTYRPFDSYLISAPKLKLTM